MDKITVIFTKTNWSLVSWLIRWTLPRSRFALALSSHCYIKADNYTDGEFLYEADPIHGVRIIKKPDAFSKRTIVVKEITFTVTNKDKGFEFLDMQLGKKYDFKAAFGIGLSPLRDWGDEQRWYCYELAGSCVKAANGPQFNSVSHITEYALMLLADKD